MCLIVNRDIHDILHGESDPFIAQYNILVFKQLSSEGFLRKKYSTPFAYCPVKFNKGVAELGISRTVRIDPAENFQFVVNEGIHSVRAIDICYKNWLGKFYLAVIPQGTTFYVGNSNDMVSDRLIIFKNRKAYLKFVEQGNTIFTAEEMYG